MSKKDKKHIDRSVIANIKTESVSDIVNDKKPEEKIEAKSDIIIEDKLVEEEAKAKEKEEEKKREKEYCDLVKSQVGKPLTVTHVFDTEMPTYFVIEYTDGTKQKIQLPTVELLKGYYVNIQYYDKDISSTWIERDD